MSTTPSGSVWLVPGNGVVCMVVRFAAAERTGSSGCADTSVAAAGLLTMTATTQTLPGETLIAGVVSDGVTSVRVDEAGGAQVSVPVVSNAYTGVATAAPASLTLLDGATVVKTVAAPTGS
ncbi:MAG: hypothetical protein ACR2ND_15290 [Solirubrobacteraceae bacterium]